MGHEQIAVLDGGLPAWHQAGFETTTIQTNTYGKGNFKAYFNKQQVRDINFIKNNIHSNNAKVIDARSSGRFNGTAPEPRKGLPSGHIPNSLSLPFTEVLEDGHFKAKEELITIFNHLPIKNQSVVYSCGSGVTACILYLASEIVEENTAQKSIYDGSWTEWATTSKTVE